MDGYKHYIRIDANSIVIHRFSNAFETPQEGDICVATDAGRHYNEPITNERDQLIYRWDGTNQVLRDQEELDAEWASLPPTPPSELELIGQAIVERELEVLQLQSDNELLGQQLVSLELRLLEGGL